MFRALSLVVTLFAFWLLLSGQYQPFFVSVGLLCGLGAVWLARRMDVMDHEGHPIHLGPSALSYWPWLAKEILKSGWSVALVILHPRLPIEPTLVRMRPSQRTDVGLVVHANSITLTPGTISVEVAPGEFVVHALTRAGAEGVVSGGEMDARVARFEGSR